MPSGLAAMAQPVSVCHQWSITGTPSWASAQSSVSGSQPLAGEEQSAQRTRDRSLRMQLPSGSSFLIARKAVGAVNRTLTLCSAITRQKAPASGVPTGLPSYRTVVLPFSSGA